MPILFMRKQGELLQEMRGTELTVYLCNMAAAKNGINLPRQYVLRHKEGIFDRIVIWHKFIRAAHWGIGAFIPTGHRTMILAPPPNSETAAPAP